MDAPPEWNFERGRIVALDMGQRRIGVACSDGLGVTAQGLPTLERTNRQQDLAALAELGRARGAGLWLLGLPRHMSGSEGRQAESVRRWGEALGRHTRLPVTYWDERLTTVEASRVLDAAHASRASRRQAIDRLAAVILLQSFLDALHFARS
ncbi:MAG: Holliday junction resolvase RuvX [Terriglobales bacterium]